MTAPTDDSESSAHNEIQSFEHTMLVFGLASLN